MILLFGGFLLGCIAGVTLTCVVVVGSRGDFGDLPDWAFDTGDDGEVDV